MPGLDLGDSASFQTAAGSLNLTPRQAYPLYHGLGNLFVWAHPGEPARALNLASAVYGAIAVAIAAYLGYWLSESIAGGAAGALFLAFSYTFWTQAITAEVYTLHLVCVGASALALLAWARRPTVGRLAIFYAIFATGFGNHLSMVLLVPAFAAFILLHRPRGAANPLRLQLIGLAVAIATIASLQYAWNVRGMWTSLEPPTSLIDAVEQFWFDVTKADWRETLVMTVSETGLSTRPSMYWFDLRQQIGVPGVVLAIIGMLYIALRWPTRGLLVALLYASNLTFAWTYNVGDPYIFFMPSHYVVALSAGAGVSALMWAASRIAGSRAGVIAGAALLAYPLWRGYDTFPAVDRSWDRRAEQLLDDFTSRGSAVYVADANWQVQNAVEYFTRERKPHIPWFLTEEFGWLTSDVDNRAARLVEANRDIGRAVVGGPVAVRRLRAAGYSGTVEAERQPDFAVRVRRSPPGTPYVFAILRPDREFPVDADAMRAAWTWVAGDAAGPELQPFVVVAGRVGEQPLLTRSAGQPYRLRVRIDNLEVDIRMESWLPTDTIRRAGFGHVLVDRRHVLTIERGLSFAPLTGGHPVYGSGLFAPIPHLRLGIPSQQ